MRKLDVIAKARENGAEIEIERGRYGPIKIRYGPEKSDVIELTDWREIKEFADRFPDMPIPGPPSSN